MNVIESIYTEINLIENTFTEKENYFFDALQVEITNDNLTIFYLDDMGAIRCKQPYFDLCPINYLAMRKFGRFYLLDEIAYAAKKLLLPIELASKIAMSADNHRLSYLFDQDVRNKLLSIFNFE